MDEIAVKSYVSGRARLKSKYFNKNFVHNLENNFKVSGTNYRVNEKCHSIIVFFDENIVTLEQIMEHFADLLQIENVATLSTTKQSISACNVSSCATCVKSKPSNWKSKLLTFAALSVYAVIVFIEENLALTLLPAPLTMAVAIFAAIPLLKDALQDIQTRRFTLQTFMSMSLLGAVFLGEVGTAFEVIYILRGGMLLEEWMANKSKAKIHELLENDVKKAYVLVDDVEIETDLEDVKKGDVVAVRSGEKIPVDGDVIWGEADVSEALINGRSEPALKKKDDVVFANTLVEKGRIHIRVSKTGNETYLARITAQVEQSLQNRSPSEKAADVLASRLLRLGTFLTGFTFLVTGSFQSAFSVMIVMSCPCATILAASTAISAGIAKGAKEGILIKGGEYLENFSKCDVVCFDKTGTLTTGKPVVVDVILREGVSEEELFYNAALAEYRNSHPIAKSIVEHSKTFGVHIEEIVDSEVLPGLGAKATINSSTIHVGNGTLCKNYKIPITKYKKLEQKYTKDGKTVVYVSRDKKVLGFIVFEHEIRENSQVIVKELKKRGVKQVVLLTGDDERVAHSFAKQYHFDKVYANIMPEEKAKVVRELKKSGNLIAMIGDGINDTIAMGEANVGVSFASGGSEAAIEVSDIAITNSKVEDILKLHDLSRRSLQVVEQNYWIGTGTNMIGVGFATFGSLSPAAAGAIHIVHTVGIMANASRISIETDNNC